MKQLTSPHDTISMDFTILELNVIKMIAGKFNGGHKHEKVFDKIDKALDRLDLNLRSTNAVLPDRIEVGRGMHTKINCEYLEQKLKERMTPAKKMTVAEIEALLGYKVEVVSDC